MTAVRLHEAQRNAVATPQLPEGISIDEAYAIQHAVLDLRLAAGERLVGTKFGFTSRAKMAQMGVSDIIVGQLTDAMRVEDGGEADLTTLVHPRVEPEIVFRLARDVDPTDPLADIVSAVDAVAPAVEIIDSRYWDFKFNLADVIADNTSGALFAIGGWRPIADIGNLAVRLSVDGRDVQFGSTAAILGHPFRALRQMVGIAARQGFPLRAGHVILAGAATAAVPFGPSVVRVDVAGLGGVTVRGR
ncbi:2-keto-4-pentenoate hydratase [Kutzneria buriramensis]|uniref:2-oxo-3-hexenedioate decarboxylase n=1 Tax=Kutzneria buriramensis TaxID=1045776 RepID=A0A3E0GXJ7_9PSEU|nr:fumarylacetoacetate hydrolase family protein [Kutzneria buriramensis]REH32954.1 2-oxo-3-hexenedioate decarboxylase [Kutzneria buriramensis]